MSPGNGYANTRWLQCRDSSDMFWLQGPDSSIWDMINELLIHRADITMLERKNQEI